MEILSACRGGMQLLLKNLRHYLAGGGVASAAVTPSLLLRLAFRFRDAVVVPRGAFEHDPFLAAPHESMVRPLKNSREASALVLLMPPARSSVGLRSYKLQLYRRAPNFCRFKKK